jgi:hypothetical protein
MGIASTKLVTLTRLIEEQIAFVQQDMKVHYSDVIVNLLDYGNIRGNVEFYFKHRYRAFNYWPGLVN